MPTSLAPDPVACSGYEQAAPVEPARAGRPLDGSRDEALRRAALELIAEVGYDRLTIDAVAARARAGKATVYRRWPSKAALVVDAFVEETFGHLVVPDTGSLRGDLTALSHVFWFSTGPVPRAKILAGMVSAMLGSPELRATFQAACRPPEEVVTQLLTRAVGRGEISSSLDMETVGAVLPSMCMFRLVMTGSEPEPAYIESVIDHLLLPALGVRTQPTRRRRRRPS